MGEETREYLSSKADEGRDYAQRKARELRERAEDLIERSKEIMARQKDAIASAVESRQGKLQARSEDFLGPETASNKAGKSCRGG